MKPDNCTSSCRYCRFYSPEGRRGGICVHLGVEVESNWKPCQFASPVFQDNWQPLPEIVLLEKSFSLGCATPKVSLTVKTETRQKDYIKVPVKRDKL